MRLLAEQTPANFITFDLLALDDADLTGRPLLQRRQQLERVLAGARPPVHLTPATTDADTAGAPALGSARIPAWPPRGS